MYDTRLSEAMMKMMHSVISMSAKQSRAVFVYRDFCSNFAFRFSRTFTMRMQTLLANVEVHSRLTSAYTQDVIIIEVTLATQACLRDTVLRRILFWRERPQLSFQNRPNDR